MTAVQFKAQCHALTSMASLTTMRSSATDRSCPPPRRRRARRLCSGKAPSFAFCCRQASSVLRASAFLLGMVGLMQFLPTALLVLVAGHAADRYQRKRVVQLCQLAEALTALFLALGAYAGWLTVAQIFIATAILGTTGAFESPATAALLPLIAPQGALQRATALSSGATQVATIARPPLRGFAYATAPR